MSWLNVLLIVYALIMLGGGIAGYVTAQSTSSLLAGLISSMALIGAVAYSKTNQKVAYAIAGVVILVLIGIFLERYLKVGGGRNIGLVGLSVAMLIALAVGHFVGRR